jgi:hypothetical protein
MDKKEHIKGKVVEEEQETQQDEKNEFEDVVGQALSINIVTSRESLEDDSWECRAVAQFAVSIDGEFWAQSEFPVKAIDKSAKNAISTVMMAVSNHVNDDNVYDKLISDLRDHETKLESEEEEETQE